MQPPHLIKMVFSTDLFRMWLRVWIHAIFKRGAKW